MNQNLNYVDKRDITVKVIGSDMEKETGKYAWFVAHLLKHLIGTKTINKPYKAIYDRK